MRSRNALESDLVRLVDAVVGIEGVVAVILFGNRALNSSVFSTTLIGG